MKVEKKNYLIISIMIAAFISLSPGSLAQDTTEKTVTIYGRVKAKVYDNSTFFINDINSPVQIIGVKARHIPEETAEMAKIILDEFYQNLTDTEIEKLKKYSSSGLAIEINAKGNIAVAVKFGVVAYDSFKEYLGGLTAVTMDPPTSGMKWEFRPAYLFKFKKYGVVGVYVRQVRLNDGSIWKFDVVEITEKMSTRFAKITQEQILNSD